MANKKKNHTANHIISTFLMSNRSLKKIYKLNATRIALIRYICDSIDMNFNKRKSLSTKLYQTQIAKHCHLERRTAGDHLKIIIKKRFLNWNENTHIYTLGKVLSTWGDSPHQIEVGRFAPSDRSGANRPISNSSNFTNTTSRSANSENQRPKAPLVQPKEGFKLAPTAIKTSTLLDNFMNKQKGLINE